MNSKNYEYRFEIKPGRYIYLPTKEARTLGKEIRKKVLASWTPDPIFFHLTRAGGHVSAMRHHKSSHVFAGTDISNFFGSVTRTKIHRSLAKIGFSAPAAFEIASASVVAVDGRRFLPYGFIQSMALATLALEKSQLGIVLRMVANSAVKISVFVDDIILSSDDPQLLSNALAAVEAAAATAGFLLCSKDATAVSTPVNTFNCSVSHENTEILPDRIDRFENHYLSGNDCAKAAIIRYIAAINQQQADDLLLSIRF